VHRALELAASKMSDGVREVDGDGTRLGRDVHLVPIFAEDL
jgi:hypothetical protein